MRKKNFSRAAFGFEHPRRCERLRAQSIFLATGAKDGLLRKSSQ
jgi:hypothetical protein